MPHESVYAIKPTPINPTGLLVLIDDSQQIPDIEKSHQQGTLPQGRTAISYEVNGLGEQFRVVRARIPLSSYSNLELTLSYMIVQDTGVVKRRRDALPSEMTSVAGTLDLVMQRLNGMDDHSYVVGVIEQIKTMLRVQRS